MAHCLDAAAKRVRKPKIFPTLTTVGHFKQFCLVVQKHKTYSTQFSANDDNRAVSMLYNQADPPMHRPAALCRASCRSRTPRASSACCITPALALKSSSRARLPASARWLCCRERRHSSLKSSMASAFLTSTSASSASAARAPATTAPAQGPAQDSGHNQPCAACRAGVVRRSRFTLSPICAIQIMACLARGGLPVMAAGTMAR